MDLYIRGPGREGTSSIQHPTSVRLTSYHWPYFQSRKGDVPPSAEGDLEESVFRAELKPRPCELINMTQNLYDLSEKPNEGPFEFCNWSEPLVKMIKFA